MRLINRTRRTAAALQDADTAAIRTAARLTPLETKEAVPETPESDLAHALRTRRMLRQPISTRR